MDGVSLAPCLGTAASLRSVAERFRTEARRNLLLGHIAATPFEMSSAPAWPEVPIYDKQSNLFGQSFGLTDTDWRKLYDWPNELGAGLDHWLRFSGRLWCARYLWRPGVSDFTPKAIRRDEGRNDAAIACFETLASDALGLFPLDDAALPPEPFRAESFPREPSAAHRWLEIIYGLGGAAESTDGTFRLARLRGSIWLASAEVLERLAEKASRPAVEPAAGAGPRSDAAPGKPQSADVASPPPKTPVKPKKSTVKGEGQAKLIAALAKHHKYADGECLNMKPIGNNQLAEMADVARSTVHGFFKKQFGSLSEYRATCARNPSGLAMKIGVLNGDVQRKGLAHFGRNPPGEGGRDEE